MKKFLIAGSSLAAVAAAGSAGAVDVTLGGSIDMGVEFGVGKNKGSLAIGDAYNSISLSLAAAGTTDGGMKYGGSFTLSTAEELEFSLYGDDKKHFKYTVKNFTDLEAAVYDVSGGMHIPEENIVAVKINSSWRTVSNNTRTDYGYPVALSNDGVEYASTNICKIAGRVDGDRHYQTFLRRPGPSPGKQQAAIKLLISCHSLMICQTTVICPRVGCRTLGMV